MNALQGVITRIWFRRYKETIGCPKEIIRYRIESTSKKSSSLQVWSVAIASSGFEHYKKYEASSQLML